MPNPLPTHYVLLPGYKCPYRAVPGRGEKIGHGGCVQALQAHGEDQVRCAKGHLYLRNATPQPVSTWREA